MTTLKALSGEIDISGLDTIEDLIPEFTVSLKRLNRSPATIYGYLESARQLDAYLRAEGLPTAVADIETRHIERWLLDLGQRWRPATVANRQRSTQAFFKWAQKRDYVLVSPMAPGKLTATKVTPPEIPIIPESDIKTLLRVCDAKNFSGIRDTALLRLFWDSGCRLAEVTNLELDDVDLDHGEIFVTGKGNRGRVIPIGDRTRRALRAYLKVRPRHPLALTSKRFWLGHRGKEMTRSGIYQMMERRCAEAGIERINPHRFRHTQADFRMRNGLSEGDAMRIFGWKSRQMLDRYASSTAGERARDAARRQGFSGDRI